MRRASPEKEEQLYSVPQHAPLQPVQKDAKSAVVPALGLSHMLLRGCPNCGHPHPLAAKGALYVLDGKMTVSPEVDPEHCPGCGLDVLRPSGWVDVQAKVTGWSPSAIAARAALGIGQFFAAIARMIK